MAAGQQRSLTVPSKGTRLLEPTGSFVRSCEPLVSLSKALVECTGLSSRSSAKNKDDEQPNFSSRPCLTSNSSSTSFDIQTFPSRASVSRPRNEFEQLFDIVDTDPVLAQSQFSRFTLTDKAAILDEDEENEGDSSATTSTAPGNTRHRTYTAPLDLTMNLRRYATNDSDTTQHKSLRSRLFGLGHDQHTSASHGSDIHNGDLSAAKDSHTAPLEVSGSDSFSQGSSISGSSREYLLTSSASTTDSAHSPGDNCGAPATTGASATHSGVVNTPLPIPHSNPLSSQSSSQSLRPPVQLTGRNDDTPKVLTATIARELRALLPVRQRLAKGWRLVYSMDQHGISINSMFSLCAGQGPLVLAIKDSKGKVFGAFLNEPLRLSPSFYGHGTCFLWKAFRSTPESRKKDAVKNFKYTGDNEYFILCDPDFVAIGGGRGKFGLWFKSDFLHGYSARCPTFNNEPLCIDPSHPRSKDPDAQQEFVVAHLEIWAFSS